MANFEKALAAFETADYADLDCGTFDVRVRQAAVHNEKFRAAVASRTMAAKRKSLVPEKGSMTGSFDQDVELFLDAVIVGWGERPLTDDDGKEVEYSRDFARGLFVGDKRGRALFGKIMQAAVSDQVFALDEADEGNS